MARFLVAWEYGEDLGHLRRVMPIGRALRSRGHDVSFAFREATRLGLPSCEGFAAWPAPLLRRPGRFDPAPLNAADVLLNLGFRDVASLRGVQRAWDVLLEVATPQALICDYAPSAMLAAARHGLPRVTVGSGFALPASFDPLPAIRPGATADAGALRRVDAQLARNIAEALDDPVPPPLEWLFRGEDNVLTTWPELDPLGPREARYLGPMPASDEGLETAWDAGSSARVLAYLKPRDARFGAVLQALRDAGVRAIVAAPGLDAQQGAALTSERVRVMPHALRLAPLLEGIDLCIGHGGPGFAADALRAGVPLLLLPMHLEQELLARRLVANGVAAMHLGDPAMLGAALSAALSDRDMRERAARWAREAQSRANGDPAHEVAERAEKLVH